MNALIAELKARRAFYQNKADEGAATYAGAQAEIRVKELDWVIARMEAVLVDWKAEYENALKEGNK